METPPQDLETIQMLEEEYYRSGYNIKAMLRVLFNSDAFKNAQFRRIKSPVETVIGTLRMVGDWTEPKPGFEFIFDEMKYMGQELLNPPSVEGWHTGRGWIDGGTLVHRINFTADFLGDTKFPGIQDIIEKLADVGPAITPGEMVDGCPAIPRPLRTVRRKPPDAHAPGRQGRRGPHRHRRVPAGSGRNAPAHRLHQGVPLRLGSNRRGRFQTCPYFRYANIYEGDGKQP